MHSAFFNNQVYLVSVTSLSSYLYCPRKLFLQTVLCIEEPPKEAMLKGTIRHETYDSINKIEEYLVKGINEKMSFADLLNLYKTKHTELLQNAILKRKNELAAFNLDPNIIFNQTLPLVFNETTARAKNLHRFMSETNLLGSDLWNALVPKIKSEIRINSPKLRLKGVIDKAEFYDEKTIVPFELKTGKAPREGVWDGHRMQIGAYCLLLQEKFSTRVRKGYIHYLDSKEVRPVVMNPFLESEINETVSNVLDMQIKKSLPDFCENRNKCINCSSKEICYNKEKLKDLLKS